ncbi:MarR family winged helix-turn-helix transcriptional regulator [Allorhizobium taibaishanense]|uniref:MarR family transcriptional regulator n=1 Tax=Allorhizobium taibaishanense TaxID=887144 RepID=A0A1Q9AAD9_9HYPH|nr:MarR family transcriptional regulator [Allorhizobium taibaishanense]MBB4007009.1 DNA-binding MarR family transcriptional regulator [Allorhizobium taibaishanense]OLP51825.1 MarR family transcriptional regulator [Allorhizobium taibaishanense]
MPQNPTLGFLLHDVARLLRKRFEQRTRDIGLTRTQWQTLVYLARLEGASQKQLAEMMEVEPITLARVADKLCEKGLIERRPDETDRRINRLHLTDLSRPLISELHARGDATRAEALEGISAEDLARFFEILLAMKTNLVGACRSTACE